MLERFQDPDGFTGYRSPALRELGVPHLFSTRRGAGGAELDAGDFSPPQRDRLCRAAGAASARIVGARQVHGDGVVEVEGQGPEPPPRADALVTGHPRTLVVVRTADCVPVLVSRADGTRVAAVHAGWRGLVAGVLARALEVVGGGELVAAVGPCLSLERFEVGPEVAARFEAAGLESAVFTRPARKPHVDLRRAAAIQLERLGVRRIDSTDRCTWNHAEDFFSYRRDVTHGPHAKAGRLAALIGPANR